MFLLMHMLMLSINVISCFFRFIPGSELRVGVIESEADKLVLLPVLDYPLIDQPIRYFEHKLEVENGIPTG